MTDHRAMLAALLADERLGETERSHFEEMSSQLELSPRASLPKAQAERVERRHAQLRLAGNRE